MHDGFSHGAAEEHGSSFSEESEGWKEVEVTGASNRLSRGFEVERGFYEIADDCLGPVVVGTCLRCTARGDNTEGVGWV